MVELEASACGVPVVVYAKDPESPFLPKKSDARELANLLDALASDADFCDRYAKECREYVLNKHEAGKVAGQFASIAGPKVRSVRNDCDLTIGDLAHIELGTGLEIVERIAGGRVSALRNRLIGS